MNAKCKKGAYPKLKGKKVMNKENVQNIAYVRVSTVEQNEARQVEALERVHTNP